LISPCEPRGSALDNDELEGKWRFKTTGFAPFFAAVDIFQPMITIEKTPRGQAGSRLRSGSAVFRRIQCCKPS
jgi:hypothetical protein